MPGKGERGACRSNSLMMLRRREAARRGVVDAGYVDRLTYLNSRSVNLTLPPDAGIMQCNISNERPTALDRLPPTPAPPALRRMDSRTRYFRLRSVVIALLVVGVLSGLDVRPAAAQRHEEITFVLPHFFAYQRATDAQFAAEVAQLRSRIGEGEYVRVGFTIFVSLHMDAYTPNESSAAASMAPLVTQIDGIIARARKFNIPICLSFLTAIRSNYDVAQLTSEASDRRVSQWHSDNSIARGWWTHSRYARFQRRVREAHVRALGRVIANRMEMFPDTLVAVTGDAEVELSFEESLIVKPNLTPATSRLADYSPFAVAEFRDWLRHDGLYAPGEQFAGQGYELGHRYAGDALPGVDTNGDGHTLNGDFGTAFDSWNLRYFNWSLGDSIRPDPRAIPDSVYDDPAFDEFPDSGALRFDPPRSLALVTPFRDVWTLFRQVMIWRYNLEFAEWMTTSEDPTTGKTVPVSRFYSDQIPADYLFGGSPTNPNYRLHTSASPHWTADVTPYGSLGVTAFNVVAGGNLLPTLRNVAPAIAERNVRWGLFEYNAAVPATTDPTIYREDMAVLEDTRPSLIVPVFWDTDVPPFFIRDTGFETALRELVDKLKNSPLPAPSGPLSPTPPPAVPPTPTPDPSPGPANLPGAPTALTATVDGFDVRFSWLPPSAMFAPLDRAIASSFVLEVGSGSGLADLALLPVGNVTSLEATGPAGSYVVAIRGVNAAGQGPRSNEVFISLPGAGSACQTAPTSPTNLTSTTAGRTVTLAWNSAVGCAATSYVIEAGSSPSGTNLANVDTGSSGTVFVAQDVGVGTYFIRVRARNANGVSATSNEVLVQIQ